MTEPLLSMRDLGVTLHRDGVANRVLDSVSLDMAPGRITALVGESGSGKSSIGLAIQGLLPQEARPVVTGSIRLAGVEVVGSRPAVLRDLRRRLVRTVPQDPLAALDPVMRLGRQMREGAAPGQDPSDWLPRVGLSDAARLLAAWPHQLSVGSGSGYSSPWQ
jgi:peptide/nickel transport system ATP-binding protein